MKLVPLGDRVVLKPQEAEKTTKLGEKEATVTFELVKQGSDWKVTGPNQELLPIFTSHALDALRNLSN